jgi:hypothetical protein
MKRRKYTKRFIRKRYWVYSQIIHELSTVGGYLRLNSFKKGNKNEVYLN